MSDDVPNRFYKMGKKDGCGMEGFNAGLKTGKRIVLKELIVELENKLKELE